MSANESDRQSEQIIAPRMITLALCIVIVILTGIIAVLALRPVRVVSTFDQCKAAGGTQLDIYPEQCSIGDTTCTNPHQGAAGNAYIGMSESEALAKAKQDNVPARVVERDGIDLPVTMDFVFGRYNLYVKENVVYKTEVEGQADDTPLQE